MTDKESEFKAPSSPSWPPTPLDTEAATIATRRFWLFDNTQVVDKASIWRWWLLRLPVYNALLFLIGITSIVLCVFLGGQSVAAGEDFVEPLAIIFGVPIYAFAANVCYMAGPTFDTWVFIGKPRIGTFVGGFVFASCLTALPGAWAVTAYVYTTITGHRLS